MIITVIWGICIDIYCIFIIFFPFQTLPSHPHSHPQIPLRSEGITTGGKMLYSFTKGRKILVWWWFKGKARLFRLKFKKAIYSQEDFQEVQAQEVGGWQTGRQACCSLPIPSPDTQAKCHCVSQNTRGCVLNLARYRGYLGFLTSCEHKVFNISYVENEW